MLRISVVLDCADPVRLAAFWREALGYEQVAADDTYIGLRDPDRARPTLVLQRVPEPKPGKNRMHLDLFSNDFAAELERLSTLGASTLTPPHLEEDGMTLTVLADPEGNEFCLIDPGDG